MNVFQILDADNNLVAEFEDNEEAAQRYVDGASNGPFTINMAQEMTIQGATEDES